MSFPKLIEVLQQKLIDKATGGVAGLGMTTATALRHTSDLFDPLTPGANEVASIALAERTSVAPILTNDIASDLADTYRLATADLSQLFSEAEQIGFVDTEEHSINKTLLFNGNLFLRDTTQKIKVVLESLNTAEQAKLNELTETLRKRACVSTDQAFFQKVKFVLKSW